MAGLLARITMSALVCVACTETDRVLLTAHHIQPRSLGGKETPENLICLCDGCHKFWHWYEDRKKFRARGLSVPEFWTWLEARQTHKKLDLKPFKGRIAQPWLKLIEETREIGAHADMWGNLTETNARIRTAPKLTEAQKRAKTMPDTRTQKRIQANLRFRNHGARRTG